MRGRDGRRQGSQFLICMVGFWSFLGLQGKTNKQRKMKRYAGNTVSKSKTCGHKHEMQECSSGNILLNPEDTRRCLRLSSSMESHVGRRGDDMASFRISLRHADGSIRTAARQKSLHHC